MKRGTLGSCQQAKDNVRVNILAIVFHHLYALCRAYIDDLTIFAFLLQRNSEHIIQIPLRVEILHTAIMAHQSFALRLGAWFQKIIGYSGR